MLEFKDFHCFDLANSISSLFLYSRFNPSSFNRNRTHVPIDFVTEHIYTGCGTKLNQNRFACSPSKYIAASRT
ncbi:unnamed protein product [Arabidopsis halleri]